jgi:hypothetical protein
MSTRNTAVFFSLFAISGLGLCACSASSSATQRGSSGGSVSTSAGGGGVGNVGGSGDGGGLALGGAGQGGSVSVCNPAAYDFPGNGLDEDCSGVPDDEPSNCDANNDVANSDAMAAARALGLCRVAQGASWGVIGASYVLADGTPGMNPASHGLLPSFGPTILPREGQTLLVLSSGTARRPGDPGFESPAGAEMGTVSPMPAGFPIPSPSCPGVLQAPGANDAAALEIDVRVPINAKGLRFDFDFYTYEFPDYICSAFNDFFVALVSPAPAGSQQGNVSFDSQGNPVSVNNGFLEVCVPQVAGNKSFPCGRGSGELQGTGFDEQLESGPHAATGWLTTETPVTPGSEIKIRFAIWDAGDHILDSSVLLDNFVWLETEVTGPSTKPVK